MGAGRPSRRGPPPALGSLTFEAPFYVTDTPCHLETQECSGKKGRGALRLSPHRGPYRGDHRVLSAALSIYLCDPRRPRFRRGVATTPKSKPGCYAQGMRLIAPSVLPELLQVFAQNSPAPTLRSVLAHDPPTPHV